MSYQGVDVSKHNGTINWNNFNKDFAIIRLGWIANSQNEIDERFEENYRACKEHNIPVGVYVYTYVKTNERLKECAKWVVSKLQGKQLDLPVYFDLEDNSLTSLGKNKLTSMVIDFNTIIEQNGFWAGLYGNPNWFRNYLNIDELKKRYTIWIAHYGVDQNKYNGQYDLFQYTSTGRASGINGNVDLNIMYRDLISEIKGTNANKPVEPQKPVQSGDNTIRTIQSWLNSNYNTNISVDGYYGNETRRALTKALQCELNKQYHRGLAEDGLFGNLTYNACPNIRQGARGNITHIIQSMLYCKGYNTNGVDGIFGSGTTQAVKDYQRNNGLSADGIVGRNTFRSLFK